MRTLIASLAFLVAVGCGGKSKSDAVDPCKDKKMMEEHHEEGGGEEAGEHPELTPEMAGFHDVLAPLWHADPGPDREANACDNGGELLNAAAAIQDAGPPEGVSGGDWDANVQVLMLSIQDLMDTCSGSSKNLTFDQAFGAVHDGFHGLMDLLPKG
jgi:hypothetical protein